MRTHVGADKYRFGLTIKKQYLSFAHALSLSFSLSRLSMLSMLSIKMAMFFCCFVCSLSAGCRCVIIAPNRRERRMLRTFYERIFSELHEMTV